MAKRTSTSEASIDPVLYEPPTVTIRDRTYPLRRLGTRDTFRVARILGRGASLLAHPDGSIRTEQVLQVLIASFTANEDEVMTLLASLIDVPVRDLEDPAQFQPEHMIDIMQALAEHQDLAGFLGKLEALMETSQEMQTRSRAS